MISVCRVVYGDITCRHRRASPPRRSPRGGGELSRTAAGARGGVSVARHPPLNAPDMGGSVMWFKMEVCTHAHIYIYIYDVIHAGLAVAAGRAYIRNHVVDGGPGCSSWAHMVDMSSVA